MSSSTSLNNNPTIIKPPTGGRVLIQNGFDQTFFKEDPRIQLSRSLSLAFIHALISASLDGTIKIHDIERNIVIVTLTSTSRRAWFSSCKYYYPSANRQSQFQIIQDPTKLFANKRQSYLYSNLGYYYENGSTVNNLPKLHKHQFSYRMVDNQTWHQTQTSPAVFPLKPHRVPSSPPTSTHGVFHDALLVGQLDQSGQVHHNNNNNNNNNSTNGPREIELSQYFNREEIFFNPPRPNHIIISVNNNVGEITCGALLSHDLFVSGSYLSNPTTKLNPNNKPRGSVSLWDLHQGQLIHTFNDNFAPNDDRLVPRENSINTGGQTHLTTHDVIHPAIAAAMESNDDELSTSFNSTDLKNHEIFITKTKLRQKHQDSLISKQQDGIGFTTAVTTDQSLGYNVFAGFSSGVINCYDIRRMDRPVTSIDMPSALPQQKFANYRKYQTSIAHSQARYENFTQNAIYSHSDPVSCYSSPYTSNTPQFSIVIPKGNYNSTARVPSSFAVYNSYPNRNIWVSPLVNEFWLGASASGFSRGSSYGDRPIDGILSQMWSTCWNQPRLDENYLQSLHYRTEKVIFGNISEQSILINGNGTLDSSFNLNQSIFSAVEKNNRFGLNPLTWFEELYHHYESQTQIDADKYNNNSFRSLSGEICPRNDPFEGVVKSHANYGHSLGRSGVGVIGKYLENIYDNPHFDSFSDVFSNNSENSQSPFEAFQSWKNDPFVDHNRDFYSILHSTSSFINDASNKYNFHSIDNNYRNNNNNNNNNNIIFQDYQNWSDYSNFFSQSYCKTDSSSLIGSAGPTRLQFEQFTSHDQYLLNLCHRSSIALAYQASQFGTHYQDLSSSTSTSTSSGFIGNRKTIHSQYINQISFSWKHNPILFNMEISLFVKRAFDIFKIKLTTTAITVCIEELLKCGYSYDLSSSFEVLWTLLQDYTLFYLPNLHSSTPLSPNLLDYSHRITSSTSPDSGNPNATPAHISNSICALHYDSANNRLISLQPLQLSVFDVNNAHISNVSTYTPQYFHNLSVLQNSTPEGFASSLASGDGYGDYAEGKIGPDEIGNQPFEPHRGYFHCLSVSPYDSSIACSVGDKVYVLSHVDGKC
jgi:hypothetical protein